MINSSKQHPAPTKDIIIELCARLKHNYNGYSYKTRLLINKLLIKLYTIIKGKIQNKWYSSIHGKTK